MHRRYLYLALIALAVVFLFWNESKSPSPQMMTFGGNTMGTTYSIAVLASHADSELVSDIEKQLEQIETIFSTWREDSEISRFNRSHSSDWFACSAELVEVVQASIRINTLTDGAFDVTLGPVIERWGFGKSESITPPSDLELADLMTNVGTRFLETSGQPAIRKSNPDIAINLSGIAKGYAVDRLAALVEERDIDNFMIEIGGEIRTAGSNRGRPWRVAIAKPKAGMPQAQRVISLGEATIATSGGYRNSVELLKKQYIHIIDPVTGKPVQSRTASVTVIDEDSTMRADALATALMVMPVESAIEFADNHDIAAHIMTLSDNGDLSTYSSKAFAAYLD